MGLSTSDGKIFLSTQTRYPTNRTKEQKLIKEWETKSEGKRGGLLGDLFDYANKGEERNDCR